MQINLPNNIDYTNYNSKSGMATKVWGAKSWYFLFTSIMGRYPFKLNFNSPEDLITKRAFSSMLMGLKDIIPCIFCRNSYAIFIKELPIEPFLVGRIELMYWLYLIKDKVNKKLICQENICYNDEKKRLKGLFHHGDISKIEYYNNIKEFKKNTSTTIPSPPFKEILDTYESIRAVCSKKSLSCILTTKLKNV